MPVKLFISYAHKDEAFKDELEVHLSILRKNGQIETWDDRQIRAGEEWDQSIKNNLVDAEIILFLVSADFLASNYINDIEIAKAIERHDKEECKIIPVIIRRCQWRDSDLAKFQALPTDGKSIAEYGNDRDHFWSDVVDGIKLALDEPDDDQKK